MAAGGVGTIIVGMANQLPPGQHEILHQFLLYIAPAVTVGTSAGWAFSADAFNRFRQKQRLMATTKAAKNRRNAVLDDPHASEELKQAAKKQFESVMKISMEIEDDEIRNIRADRIN